MEQTIKKNHNFKPNYHFFSIYFRAKLDPEETKLIQSRNAESLTLIHTEVFLIDNSSVLVDYKINDIIRGQEWSNDEFLNILRFEKVVKKCFKNFDKILTGLKDLPEPSLYFKPQ